MDRGTDQEMSRCEMAAPFALFGDSPQGNFNFATLSNGFHNFEIFCGYAGEDEPCTGASNYGAYFSVVDCPDPMNL